MDRCDAQDTQGLQGDRNAFQVLLRLEQTKRETVGIDEPFSVLTLCHRRVGNTTPLLVFGAMRAPYHKKL